MSRWIAWLVGRGLPGASVELALVAVAAGVCLWLTRGAGLRRVAVGDRRRRPRQDGVADPSPHRPACCASRRRKFGRLRWGRYPLPVAPIEIGRPSGPIAASLDRPVARKGGPDPIDPRAEPCSAPTWALVGFAIYACGVLTVLGFGIVDMARFWRPRRRGSPRRQGFRERLARASMAGARSPRVLALVRGGPADLFWRAASHGAAAGGELVATPTGVGGCPRVRPSASPRRGEERRPLAAGCILVVPPPLLGGSGAVCGALQEQRCR